MWQRKKISKPKVQKQSPDKIIKNIRNFFKLGKKIKAIKENRIGDIKKLFKQKEDYYKPVKVSNFWENNYKGNESKEDRNENLSLNKYLDKIKPYLKNIIIDFQNI